MKNDEMSVISQVREFIIQEEMLHFGDGVVAGLSGGADSVCLLRLLCVLRQEWNLRLCAVHVNHGIRAEAAGQDAAFAEALCGALDVPFRLMEADVPRTAREKGLSLEEAGRQVRYAAFEEVRSQLGFERIAVAHHMDDNAETILLNLCRGTNISGLCGMAPVSGYLIRPLLCVQREQIEAYLNRIGQDCRRDETNEDLNYRRNRIRHTVLPQLVQVNSQAVSHINAAADALRQIEEHLERETREASAVCIRRDGDGSVLVCVDALALYPELIRSRVLMDAMEAACGGRKDLGEIHVQALQRLCGMQSGRRIDLPGGMQAQRVYDNIRITCGTQGPETADMPSDPADGKIMLTADLTEELSASGERLAVPCGTGTLYVSVLSAEGADLKLLMRENPYTKYLDCDTIKHPLSVRLLQSGDRIVIDAAGHEKTMHRFWIDERIPLPQRSRMMAVMDGDRVVWIIGGRIGYPYRLRTQTKRILKLEIL